MMTTLAGHNGDRLVRGGRWEVGGGRCPTFLVFNFLYNNMVYTLDIEVYIYIQNIFVQNNFLVGLIFSTSWGSGHKNSKTPSRLDFLKIVLKVKKIKCLE